MDPAIRGYPLATSREERPSDAGSVHVHRGGLLVLMPAKEHWPIPMTWLSDRLYRITYCPTQHRWYLQAEDDLRWTTVATILVAPSGTRYIDVAANPDGVPILNRHDRYLVRHHDGDANCRMTISAVGA